MSHYISKIQQIQQHTIKHSQQLYCGSLITPPPNVTGRLHIGHALNISIQDAIVRYSRLNSHNIVFIPGSDHAGIHTQFLVMNSLGKAAQTMSDAQILDAIWSWKSKSEQDIIDQMKLMDTMMDWDAYKFSLDNDVNCYVTDAFCRLYEMGLIFKSKMISNWDIKLQTVVSDLEAVNKEQTGKMWYLKYYIEDTDEYIEVGTTRPETIFADVAVCVHPDDDRYKSIVGKRVRIPIIKGYVPIIADKQCSIDKGSGAVKIDPPHGFMDFDIAKIHNLPIPESIINHQGYMQGSAVQIIPELNGLDRFEAREKIGHILVEAHLVTRVEDIVNMVPFGEKSGSILEPMLTEQWFFDIPQIAQKCLDVLDGELKIYPESAKNTYIYYLSNPRPWCISRQLIWGHKIPVWYYGDRGEFVVARNEDEARRKSNQEHLRQEVGVFDTWFSSTMWPMINTINTPEHKHLYPTDMLITGRDLIFFWVARMVIMGLALTGKVPFHKVYCHGLIYDKHGQKMSKSKGNVIDPLDLFEKHGIDVVRFGLLQNAIPDHDIRFSEKNLDKAQKLMIKIWNGMNYCHLHAHKDASHAHSLDKDICPTTIHHPINRWILQQALATHARITNYIAEFMMHKAADNIYNYIWDDFCNTYIESSKVLLQSHPDETRACMRYVVRLTLQILNPFAPFISQYFWNEYQFSDYVLDPIDTSAAPDLTNDFNSIITSVNMIRSFTKAIHNINHKAHITLIENNDIHHYRPIVLKLCVNSVKFADDTDSKDNATQDRTSATQHHIMHTVDMQSLTIPCGQYNLVYTPASNDEYEKFVAHSQSVVCKMRERLDRLNQDLSNDDFLRKVDHELIIAKRNERDEIMRDVEMWRGM